MGGRFGGRVARDCATGVADLMVLGSLGRLWDPCGALWSSKAPCKHNLGPAAAKRLPLGLIFEPFWRLLVVFLGIRGIRENMHPSCTKTSFLRVGGVRFPHFF